MGDGREVAGVPCPICAHDRAELLGRIEMPTREGERARAWLRCLFCEEMWEAEL